MKTIKLTPLILIAVLFFVLTESLFSQDSLKLSELVPGKTYRVVMYDETEIIGKLSSVDSASVSIVKPNSAVVVVPKYRIYYISQDKTPLKYKASFALLGGAIIITSKNFGHLNNLSLSSESGPHFVLSGTWYFSDQKALVFDAEYSHNIPDFDGFNLLYPDPDAQHVNTITGGGKSFYSLKCNLLFGNLRPQEYVMYGVYMGLGLHVMDQRMIYMTYYQKYHGDTTYFKNTSYYAESIEIGAVLSVGGTLNFQIWKHYGIRTDIEFNIASTKGDFLFLGGRNYIPLRIGAYYIF